MAQPQGSPTAPQSVIDAVVNVESRVADFIANGPSDGLGGYVRDRYRDRCDEYANAPLWARVLANGPNGSLNRICSPWFESRGFDGPSIQGLGEGGQCPVNYTATWEVRRFNQALQAYEWGPASTGPLRLGPMEIRNVTPPGATCTVPGEIRQDWIVVPSGGANYQIRSGCTDVSPGFRNLRFIRADGQPDDCGDTQPELRPGPNPPPNPGPQPGPEPTVDPRNPTGPPLLPIPPYVDPVFGPTPVEGPEDEPPTAPPVNPENGPGDPDAVGDPIPGQPSGGGEGEDVSFGPPPEGRSWVGCYVRLDVPDSYGDIPGSRPGNAVFPRVVGNISLLHGDRRSQAIQLRSEWTDIFRVSPAQPVDGVRVNVLPSISYLVYPVSVPLCPESTCPPPGGEEPPAS